MRWFAATLLAATVLSPTTGDGVALGTSYRIVACLATADFTTIRFERARDGSRLAVFMDQYRQFLLESPDRYGPLNWRDVIAILIEPSNISPDEKFLTIRYVDYETRTPTSFEMGLINKRCLTKIKKRYGKFLKFVER